MLGGMDTPTSGTIMLDGREITGLSERDLTLYRRYDIGFVFQFYNLVQNLTALENVELASQICKDPLPAEEEACIGFLREQVRLIQPKIIVCLGRIAAMKLIKPDFKITKEHGVYFQKGPYLMTAVYHPALLLRDPHKKEDMLVDMKSIKQKIDELK
jgi:uracil-DNA glycosylase